MNIVDIIRAETRDFSANTAIIEGTRTITYGQLLQDVAACRDLLRTCGLAPGQRIAFRCRDGIDYVLGALALLDTQVAIVPLADTLTETEIQNILTTMDVQGVLTHSDLTPAPPSNTTSRRVGAFLWQPRQATGEMDHACCDLEAAFIRFSSGTTGLSKGVLLSHRTIFERTSAANRGLQIDPADVILWVLGMSHHFVVSILLFLRRAATIHIANREFPFSLLEAVVQTPVTFIYASPMHYHLLTTADSVPPQALSRVRLAISTAMKMPRAIAEAFHRKFGFQPAQAYGIIEIGLPFINTDPENGPANTVGPALPDYQLKIAHPDSAGIGEVLLRGPGMFDAYCSPWRNRDACLDEGWFHTGDLGRLDEHGRLCLLGRCKTVLICAGMKIFPEEVEEVLNAQPGVLESRLFGQDHPELGQVPVASVVLRPSAEPLAHILTRLRQHCCQVLSSYKVPVEFQVVAALAKTPSGKLARHLPSPQPDTATDDQPGPDILDASFQRVRNSE